MAEAQDNIDMMAPFREDICKWLNHHLNTKLQPATLIRELASGDHLCHLANVIDEAEQALRQDEQLNPHKDSVASPASHSASGASTPNCTPEHPVVATSVSRDPESDKVSPKSQRRATMRGTASRTGASPRTAGARTGSVGSNTLPTPRKSIGSRSAVLK